MASSAHSLTINVCDVFHHPEFNAARPTGDYGSESEVAKIQASLVREGWRMNGDGVIEVEKITDEWKTRAIKDLTEKWELLKAKVETDKKNYPALHAFEANRVTKGKIIVPKYMGVSGNRRASVLDAANAARYSAEPSLPLITEIPVIVQVFANDKERVIAQCLENMGKLEGFAKMSEKDMLRASQTILAKGGIQDDLRRAFTATTGQKLYGILTLNARFPKVRLLERLVSTDATAPDHLRYGPIPGPKLPNLVLRSDPTALAKENAKLKTAGKGQLEALTAESLEEFLGTKKVNEPKIMDKKNIAALETQNPNVVVQRVAKAVTGNDTDPLNKYIAHATAFNALDSLCDKIGPEIEAILTALTRAQDLGVAVKAVKQALKV